MFNDASVRRILKKYIDEGKKQFAIYPFGENGVSVRDCLNDCFGIEPSLIVDNVYANYNEKIVRVSDLKKSYSQDMYILLTVENEGLNRELENGLLEFIPKNNIINLLDVIKMNSQNWEVGTRFAMDSILPMTVAEKKVFEEKYRVETGKIKVRFLHSSLIMWNAVKTICESFERDERFDVLIILGVNQSPEAEEQMKREGHNYVTYQEYCTELDKPDITIIYMSYETYPYDFRRHSKLVVVAPMSLIQYSYSIDDYWKADIEPSFQHDPDYYLFDSMLYNELENSRHKSDKIVEMGNAKYDGIYKACQEKKYNAGWEKLREKKVILWATDHGIYNGLITKDVTFDIYAKAIFEYADMNDNIGFILRPHKSLINELLSNGYWSQKDFDKLKQHCQLSPNVVYDDTDCYDSAFSIADAVITDAYCGITCTALPTLKPICLLYRSKECTPYHPELVDNYYSAHDVDELISYFEMLKDGRDDMLELRKAASKRFVKHFDGRNGERIKKFIEEKYFSMI